jgi:hypothetical protein
MDAQRQLQLEPQVRIAQLVAEQLVDLPHPVPDRLRVDVDPLRHLRGVLAELQPGQQCLGNTVPLARPQLGQGRQAAAAQRGGQFLVGEDQQRGQVLVAADRAWPGPRPRSRRKTPALRPLLALAPSFTARTPAPPRDTIDPYVTSK